MLRVLRLPAYYEPEMVSSSHMGKSMEEAFVSEGFSVWIITPVPTRGVSKDVRKKYKTVKREEKYEGQIVVNRFSMFSEGRNPLLRAVRYLLCNIVQFSKGIRVQDVDLITAGSTPPTQGFFAALVKKRLGVPMLYNLHDVFPDSLVDAGFTRKGSLLWRLGRLIEDYTYMNANMIRVISEDLKKNLLEKNVPEEKIRVIYNWIDEHEVSPIDKDKNILFDEYDLDRAMFHVVYAGNLGHAQDMDVILSAAGGLLGIQDIQFVIFAGGSRVDHYEEMSRKMHLTNVVFLPLQPVSLVSNVYSLGDVSIVSCKPGFGKSAMPSKTWSIMATATPVVASFDEGTELQKIIEENCAGLFAKAGDHEALKEALLKLYSNRELCREMGSNGRRFILEHLTKETVIKQYIDILKCTIEGCRCPKEA